jgi:hypothetical protein
MTQLTGGKMTINAPGQMVDRKVEIGNDLTTTIVTYDEGTILTLTMNKEGEISVHINKDYRINKNGTIDIVNE